MTLESMVIIFATAVGVPLVLWWIWLTIDAWRAEHRERRIDRWASPSSWLGPGEDEE